MTIRVALFGGSFNPPHTGHAQVVLHLLHAGFDEVWVVPASVHPFGKEMAPFPQRAEMLRLALSDFGPKVRICTVESELPGPSRTIETVEELIRRHPDHHFTLALGDDQVPDLPRWHRIEALSALVPFFFVGRGPWTPGEAAVRIPDYSSSEIRRRFAEGQDAGAFLHRRVHDFILAAQLYGASPGRSQPAPPRTAIVGLGRVGGSLLTTLCAAGAAPLWCADPDPERLADARQRHVAAYDDWMLAYEAAPEVDFLLFCTPDSWRPEVRPGFWTTSPLCLHTGGMHRPAEVFAHLGIPPERLGILHPARAVPSSCTSLSGSLFSVTGSASFLKRILPLLDRLQATTVPVAEEDRMAFHAVCALAANGSQVLEQAAEDLFLRLGIKPAVSRDLVRRLVSDSLEAWWLLGRAGFTGPWVRRDEMTAHLHEKELTRMEPGVAIIYSDLKSEAGRWLVPDAQTDPKPGPGDGNLPEKP
ncbi:DUF2520 domain-containing protein [Myxococcota bacterium]|nr:DUF2520 domain-containing protein [Myxococcota bacterium]